MDWLNEVFGYTVEKDEIKRPQNKPYYHNSGSAIGVLHTTEGTSIAGAMSAFRKNYDPPHFVAGQNKIIQCRPLTAQAAALRGNATHNPNAQAQVQIEMVASSHQKLWLPAAGTLKPAVALMAYCAQHLGIPLDIPVYWPDDCSDVKLPWAANNARRKKAAAGLWPKEKGWWMHMEVPWQSPTWHWDCGALRRSEMIRMARELLGR